MKKCVKIMTMLQKCDNILKNNQLQKSMKIAFFIYVETEALSE